MDLTGGWDMEDSAVIIHLKNSRQFFGDYVQADARGCDAWYGYVSRHQGGPSVGTYVTKVNLCLDADVDADRTLTTMDATLFANYFIQGDLRADVNHNSLLEVGDACRFMQSLSCGCNP